MGTSFSVSGTLIERDGEWALDTGSKIFNLHLGNEDYLESVEFILIAGQKAEVKGFVFETDMAVGTLTMDNQTWTLRDESGRPAWAGRGRGRNRRD